MLGGLLCRRVHQQLTTLVASGFLIRRNPPTQKTQPQQPQRAEANAQKSYRSSAYGNNSPKVESYSKTPNRTFIQIAKQQGKSKGQQVHLVLEEMDENHRKIFLAGINSINSLLSDALNVRYTAEEDMEKAYWFFVDHINQIKSKRDMHIFHKAQDLHLKCRPSATIISMVSRFPDMSELNLSRVNNIIDYQAKMCALGIQFWHHNDNLPFVKDTMKYLRFFLHFLNPSSYLTLYYLTYNYEYIVIRCRDRGFFDSELNGILSLFTIIVKSPNLELMGLFKVSIIIYFFGRYSRNLSSIAMNRMHDIIVKVLKAFPQWYKLPLIAKSVFHSLAKDCTVNSVIRADLKKALAEINELQIPNRAQKIAYVSNLIKTVLFLRIVDGQQLSRCYPSVLKILEDDPVAYEGCALNLSRAKLWSIKTYWKTLFRNVKKGMDSQYKMAWAMIVQSFYLLKDRVDPKLFDELAEAIESSEQLTSLKSITRKEFENLSNYLFHDERFNEKNFYQLEADKALTNIGVKTTFETFVGTFNVDLLINDKIIFEANGPDHYVRDSDTNEVVPTLNSLHRAQVLSAYKDYRLIEINIVEEANQSAVRVIKRILEEEKIIS